jgi:hypothetical protein
LIDVIDSLAADSADAGQAIEYQIFITPLRRFFCA